MSLRDRLPGAWSLVRWETQHPDGAVTLPYGADIIGLLLLTSDGWMSGQIMLPESEPLSPPTALVAGPHRYIAYCGPYTFDEATMTLCTRVQASVSRSWVDSEQVRSVSLDGDTLVLRPPLRPSGEQGVLTWMRLGESAHALPGPVA